MVEQDPRIETRMCALNFGFYCASAYSVAVCHWLTTVPKNRKNMSRTFLFLIGSKVYTPNDGDNWLIAKLNVQVTDLGYSQIVEHLSKVLMNTAFTEMVHRNRGEEF